tara:strand:- start:187 stop:495 length:309 start_codon:yes stop_codon:yes gene_type:complete
MSDIILLKRKALSLLIDADLDCIYHLDGNVFEFYSDIMSFDELDWVQEFQVSDYYHGPDCFLAEQTIETRSFSIEFSIGSVDLKTKKGKATFYIYQLGAENA